MAPAKAGKTAPNASSGRRSRFLDSRPAGRRFRLLTFEDRALATRVTPGQYVYLTEPQPPGVLLPGLAVAGFDRLNGTFDLRLATDPPQPGCAALLGLREGDSVSFSGPLGRGFQIDARSRYLLIVADRAGLGRVRSIVDEAVSSGRQVTLLYGADSAADVFPSTLLRDEVEYLVATADGSLGHQGPVTDLVAAYEAWADQCFAAGAPELISRMSVLARGRTERMGVALLGRRRSRHASRPAPDPRRRAWLQIALPHPAGCLLGVCLGCVVTGASAPQRACREGPAFAADELRWDSAP